jgi:hypothetical protein
MTCYFSVCSEDSARTQPTILLPSEIQLLCRGIVLKHTVDLFFKTVIPLSLHFEDDDTRICWFAYLTDIFSKLNDVNIQSDGNN